MQDATGPAFAKLVSMIEAMTIGMLTTEGHDGSLRSRPMATQRIENDVIYFFTRTDAPKVDEIRDDAKVNVSYGDVSKQTYVSVSGKATTARDHAKIRELWTKHAAPWFPGGPNDPALALMKIEITAAEYWDVDTRAMKRLDYDHASGDSIAKATDHKKLK